MYKIIIDSCGELTDSLKKDGHFCNVALELDVDGYRIRDDESFDQHDFLRRVKESVKGPKSSCPSPEEYMQAFEGEADHVYVVTLSGKLSGSYNSAVLAVNLYKEEHEDCGKQIYVFNSRSASIGETLIGMKVQEFEESGLSFDEVVKQTEEYISSMNTFFVLETLDTLRKAGRLSNLKAFVAGTLNIKPVMGSTDEGSIQQLGQARGMKRALAKMVEELAGAEVEMVQLEGREKRLKKALDKMVTQMFKNVGNTEEKVLAISHCNCPERAQYVKACLEKLARFKKIVIVDTAGISSMYANDGGIIIAV